MQKVFLLTAFVIIFIAGFFLAQDYLKRLPIPSAVKEIIINKGECDSECKKIISEEVEKAVAKLSTPLPKSVATQIASPQAQTNFISLGNSYSTTSTSWIDVPGSEVTFDIEKDYKKGAEVSFQTSLKVANANGQAFARLYDSTHGIGVTGSEISTINNSDYKNVTSGNLNLWSGSNTYKVQIRSLNSFEVTYTGGKIKIVVR